MGRLTENSQEGPWYLAKHFFVVLTRAASDASALAWGGVLRFASLLFQAGADFGPQWIARDIHVKKIYTLHELLQAFCEEFPGRLSRPQVIADVDNFTVAHNFRKGWSRDATVHRLLRAFFDLQMTEGFWLRLRWVPSEANVEADSITRPGRDKFVRVHPHVFAELWAFFGEFNIDLMASPVSAHRITATAQGAGNRLPFFTRYACDGSAGGDFFAQVVARVPGETARAFGFCFPPTALANSVVQHLAEQQAHAPHRGRAIGSHFSRDTRVTGQRGGISLRKLSRACRERQRARLVFVFPLPHWPTQLCSTSPNNKHTRRTGGGQ